VELHFIQFDKLELDAAIDALKEYGPARMGNHALYEALMKKLEGAMGPDVTWCYLCDRPKNDCGCDHDPICDPKEAA
jgi:hypothetical protein